MISMVNHELMENDDDEFHYDVLIDDEMEN